MDEKNDKQKESIDEILSDLNGLLSKMPSLLDGIKMPEVQPEEFPPAQTPVSPPPQAGPLTPQPQALNDIPAGQDDADKTIVLESFAGLSQGSQSPVDLPVEPLPLEQFPGESGRVAAGPVDADKTVVLESFSGLFEGAQVPAEILVPQTPEPASPQPGSASPAEPAFPAEEERPAAAGSASGPLEAGDAAQAGALDPQNGRSDEQLAADSGAAVPEQIKPAAQNLGAFISGVEMPQEQDLPVADLPENQEAVADRRDLALETAISFNGDEAGSEKPAAAPDYGGTRDFGIPDIDELMQMSDGETPAKQPSLVPPEAGLLPEPVQATEEGKDGPSIPVLDFASPEISEPEQFNGSSAEAPAPASPEEPQFPAASAEDAAAANEPEEGRSETPRTEAALPVPESGGFIIEPEVKKKTSFEAFTIEPSSPDPVSGRDEGETLQLEPDTESRPAQDGGETLRLEPAPEAAAGAAQEPPPAELQEMQFAFTPPAAEPEAEAGSGIQLEPPAETEVKPAIEENPGIQFGSAPEPAAGAGIELAPGIELGGGSPAQSVNFGETLPGGSGLELGGGASPSLSGDETLVADAPAGSSGEEDKTVVFQARPSTTSMAKAGDLAALAARQVPEGIPAERVRALAFLYSPGDEALCATVLSELDAICLNSPYKPMFVKRIYVKECDTDSNANFIHQSVADSGAAGLVCVGAIPQEKVYEIENAFSSSGGFFRYYEAATFGHSAALDFVLDLIVR